jgi:hypothetical protein
LPLDKYRKNTSSLTLSSRQLVQFKGKMYCIDQTTTVLLGRSYGPPDLYPIESLWTFNVKKALNFNFHTMGQKFWGFWTIVYSQMTIDLGELAQYVFLPRYSPDLAPLDFLCFLPYGKTIEEAFCIFKSNSKWCLMSRFVFRIWRKCP